MIATTVEQSKKLIELGLSADTADMHYWEAEGKEYLYIGKCSDINGTPAWSLSKLLELMPFPILHNTLSNKWRCTIYHKNGLILKTGEDVDSPLDSAFEMMKYLLENKLIK